MSCSSPRHVLEECDVVIEETVNQEVVYTTSNSQEETSNHGQVGCCRTIGPNLDCLSRAFEDPALIFDNRVLRNLLQAERRYEPNIKYFECVQTDIQVWMRNKVAGWMLEVCVEQGCESEVFPTALNYLDRFLSLVNVERTQLQLVGTVAMFLASKLKDTKYIPAHVLILYTDCSITMKDLMNWEMMMIGRLKWDMSSITACDFLEQFLIRLPFTREEQQVLRRHTQTFISLCYAYDFGFVAYPPSMMAAACIITSASGFKGPQWCWVHGIGPILHRIANVDLDRLFEAQEKIEKLVRDTHSPSRNPNDSDSSDNKSSNRQPTTPTDVRDVHM